MAAFHHFDSAAHLEQVRHENARTVDARQHAFAAMLDNYAEDLQFLAGQALLHRYLSDPEAGQAALESEYARFCTSDSTCLRVQVFDETPTSTAGFRRQAPGIFVEGASPPSIPADIGKALNSSQWNATPEPMHLEPEGDGVPVLRLLDVVGSDGGQRAVLELTYQATAVLDQLAALPGPAGSQGFLVSPGGNYLEAPDPTLSWGRSEQPTFGLQHPAAWRHMQHTPQGHLLHTTGLFTYATVDSTFIVSFVPSAALYAEPSRRLFKLFVLAGAALLAALAVSIYLGNVMAARSSQAQALRESKSRVRALSGQLLKAQELERKRFARALHENLGQLTTTVTLELERAKREQQPERRDKLLSETLLSVEQLLVGLREIETQLRPTLLEDLGLVENLRALLTDFERSTGVPHTLVTDLTVPIPSTVGDNVFRIVREGLANAAHHGHASHVRVTLSVANSALHIEIHDDGERPEKDLDAERFSLRGIAERAELFGGGMTLEGAPGRGTTIHVAFSLAINAEETSDQTS